MAILIALMGIVEAEEVGAPGMGIGMADFGLPDFSDNEVGAPGMGITMPDFGVDDWISIPSPGTWAGWGDHAGWIGGYSGYGWSGKALSYGLKLDLTGSGIVTITNISGDKMDIGNLKLVKVLQERPIKIGETLAYLPYTLILAPGASTNVLLEGNVISGDEIILTNGLGTYAAMVVP